MQLKLLLILMQFSLFVYGKNVLFGFAKSALFNYAQNILDQSEQTDCVKDLKYTLQEVKEGKLWALKMLDSVGKPGAGILSGNIRDAGSYDECIGLNNRINITGKFCITAVTISENHADALGNYSQGKAALDFLELSFNRNNKNARMKDIPMTWAVCVPASCSTNNLQSLSNFSERYFDWMTHFSFNEDMCQTNKAEPLETRNIVAITYFVSVALLVISSSIYDIIMRKYNKEPQQVLIAFSAYTNGINLFTSGTSEDSLAAINGIRVLSLVWVILGHIFSSHILFPNVNAFYVFEWKDSMSNVLIISGTYSVDSFFTIGGLLVVYVFLDGRDKGSKVSVPMFYLHRLVRLGPSLYTCILIYTCILSRLGDGPYWFAVKTFFEQYCLDNWWASMLYIQNYYNPAAMCVNHSWYLAVDTQLYFMSPIILFPFIKRPKQAIIGIVVLLISSITFTFATSYLNKYGAALIDMDEDYNNNIYLPTHVRCTPWLVGAIWGYFIFKKKNVDVFIDRKLLFVIWNIFFIVMSSLMISQVLLIRMEYNRFWAAVSNAFSKPLWAMCICWLVFACVKGYAGWINTFLSLKVFAVLARFSYNMYLVHFIVIIVMVISRRTTTYFSNINTYFEFWGYFVCTFSISVVWSLCFESPILVLEKMLTERYSTKKRPKQVMENIVNSISNNTIEMELTTQPKTEDT